MPRSPRPFYLLLWALLLASPPGASAQSVRPIAQRLDAIVSYPLVVAISADDERDLRRPVTTRLDDGRTFATEPYWVGITPRPALPAWTTPAGIWTATAYDAITALPASQRPTGSWFILIPLPVDAVGQGLWFGQHRYELNWLPDPERSLLEADTPESTRRFDAFWSMRLDPDALADPAIQAAIDQYHHDPFQNWRARLLTDGLHPDRSRARETGTTGMDDRLDSLELELSMDNPGADLLRALARQQEARWQIILGRVWLIDPSVASRLKSQLMRTARFGERTLPLWSSDTTDISRLAYDLLSPFVNDETRVLRAGAWLETQPRALAWVHDDQGEIEAGTGRLLPTLSVIALPQTPGVSLLRVEATDPAPTLATLDPAMATEIDVPLDPVPILSTSSIIETRSAELTIARWSTSLDIIASPIPARAPYVRIGPLLNDWTMNALVTARPSEGAQCAPRRSTVAMLRKVTAPSRIDPTDSWQLYAECTSPDPSSENESLTIWVGPSRFPFAVWSISPAGRVTRIGGDKATIAAPVVQTRILDDRWVATIDLPPGVFDDDAQLQLGLERTDADGIHSAWPRRMVPGQPEPGRLIIEGDRFDQLRSRDHDA